MTYLQDQLIDIEGIRIYGTPWRPRRGLIYPAEAFGYDPQRLREDIWSHIPEDIDILLTHGPPYSIRDYHPLTDERIGCPDLLEEVVTSSPATNTSLWSYAFMSWCEFIQK